MESNPLVMVVEDEKVIRDFLAAILRNNGYRVMEFSTGGEAIKQLSTNSVDLVLLDLGLPDIDGLIVLDAIRQWSSVPIIVVSAREHEKEKVEALDRGADDYVTKPFSNAELLARVRTAMRRKAAGPLSEDARPPFIVGDMQIDYVRRQVTLVGEVVHLTPNEYKILLILSANAGRVITHETLLREIWGPYVGDNQILRVNMANIRRKLERNPGDPAYILTEVGVGYRMAEPPQENEKPI